MKVKALVVDNNPVLLKAISALLGQENCLVETAENGLHAIEILEDYRPDIVFTDLIMPQVSGEQLCNILRHTKKHRDIFVVVLSATVLEDRERILREIDCDLCIAKGTLQEIRVHLQEALNIFRNKKRSVTGATNSKTKIPDGLKPSEVTSELLSEKRHLGKILTNLHEGIVELNNQGKVVAVNKAAMDILACGEEELLGYSLLDICDWKDLKKKIADWTTSLHVGKDIETFEISEQNPLELNDCVITASFIPVYDKETVFALCIIRDISRQYRAEEHNRELDNAVRLIKKMDAMSCMAGGVAHDFNNLLTVICGNLDIVALKGENFERIERERLIDQAQKAALAAVDLTRQISCFSNFGIVSRQEIIIEQLVRRAVTSFFNEKNVEFSITACEDECFVNVDQSEISVALENVLQNALESEGQGTIKIVIDFDNFPMRQLIHGQYVPAGRYARIDIEDSGQGIDKEHLFRIFDPYYSTKERGCLKGMGLGLTVVYATLRNHGGYVVVNSDLDAGTKVSLYIPQLQNGAGKEVIGAGEQLNGQPILLVEPDEQMAQIGTIMLSYLGLDVKAVGTRAEAIAYFEMKKSESGGRRPLVILDLSEKQGGTAEETCRLLHEIDSGLKIIAMSGTILDPVMADCYKYGFAATLPKPYTMDSLKHIVTATFYSRASS